MNIFKKFIKNISPDESNQDEIGKILSKGGFQIKSWECSGENSISKYLGMT